MRDGAAIYITHCSGQKDDSLECSRRKLPPQSLYTGARTQRFMARCAAQGVRWAIFSDHYGVWFPERARRWYSDEEGDPNRVSEPRFRRLVRNFDRALRGYET